MVDCTGDKIVVGELLLDTKWKHTDSTAEDHGHGQGHWSASTIIIIIHNTVCNGA